MSFGVVLIPTTTTLQLSSSSVQLGQQVTLTATVVPNSGSTKPAGTVAFFNGATILGYATLNTNAVATLTTVNLRPSSAGLSLTARYEGDQTTFATSPVSAAQTLQVTTVPGRDFSPATPTPPVSPAGSPARMVQADFDQNGVMDFAIFSHNGIAVALGNGTAGAGSGTFGTPTLIAGSRGCLDLVAVDLNEDGFPDLACLLDDGRSIDIFLSRSGSSFGNGKADVNLPLETNAIGKTLIGDFATDLVAADLNGDGHADLATASSFYNGAYGGVIDVFPGTGKGTFDPVQSSFIVPLNPSQDGYLASALLIGDFSQTGRLDAIVYALSSTTTNTTPLDFYYLRGSGTGTFTSPTGSLNAPLGGNNFPRDEVQLLRGNFTGASGAEDFVYRDLSGTIHFATPQVTGGNVTFQFEAFSPPHSQYRFGFLAVGDFNGDGKLDLAGDISGTQNFQIMLGNGDRTFALQQTVASCGDIVYASSFDYSGDGRNDLAASCRGKVDVQLARQVSSTSLTAAPALSPYGQAVQLTATVNGSSPTGSVTFYNGSELLGAAKVQAGSAALSTSLLPASTLNSGTLRLTAHYGGDATNGDSASGPFSETVTAKAGRGFMSPAAMPSVSNLSYTAVGDFNNDGIPDLAVSGPSSVTIFLGDGHGNFTPATTFPISVSAPAAIAVGDFDGNGNQDLALLFSDNSGVGIYLGDGHGAFKATAASPLSVFGSTVTGIYVGDFNNDGFADIAFGANLAGVARLYVYGGNGDGTFTSLPTTTISSGVSPLQGALGDFTGSHLGDIVMPVSNSSFVYSLYLLTGFGDGIFTPTNLNLPGNVFSVVTGDFNGDGKPDLAYSDTSGTIRVALNSGTGTFTSFSTPSGSSAGVYLATGDFNGDGHLDLAVSEPGSGNVAIFLGDNTGGFSQTSVITVPVGSSPGNIAVADFNLDSRPDFAVTVPSTGAVQVRLEAGPAITSISPAQSVAGAKNVNLTITGTNFFAGDTVSWLPSGGTATILTPTPTNLTATSIVVPIDSLLTTGNTPTSVTVTVVDPTAGVSNSKTFTINPPPTITSVAPPSAAAGGNSVSITLTGTGFVNGDTVNWAVTGGATTTGLSTVLNSNGTLTFNAGSSLLATQGQSITITVVDPSGVPSANTGTNFQIVGPPSISGLSPGLVPADSGDLQLTITGTGFVSGDCVTWTQLTPQAGAPVQLAGNPPCTTTVTSSGIQQQIVVTVPAALMVNMSSAKITVIDPDGAANGTTQTIAVQPPSISGLADSSGAPLTSVGTASSDFALTVNGLNFVVGNGGSIPGSVVLFTDPSGAAHVLTPTASTANSLTVTVPGSAIGSIANKTAQVVVLNEAPVGTIGACTAPGGITGTCSSPATTLSIGAPIITSVTPPQATTGAGNLPIVVNGSNFVANSQLVWCNQCTTPTQTITPSAVTPGQMQLSIPSNLLQSAGTVKIFVTNTPGSLTNANTNSASQPFQIATLGISTIDPTAVIAGGPAFNLTINGQNSNFDGNAQVLFGTGLAPISVQNAISFTANKIVVNVPASYIVSPGSLSIQVQDSNGAITPAVSLPIQPFTVTGVTPVSLTAGSPDTNITITGTGFQNFSQMGVTWQEGTSSTPLKVVAGTNTTLTATVPQALLAVAGSAQISVSEPFANISPASPPNPITVAGPTISTITPFSSPVKGNGFLMTVNGGNFLSTSVVNWIDSNGNSTPIKTTFTSSSQLAAFVPASLLTTAGTALVTVNNGTVGSNGTIFAIGPAPTITPGSGLALCQTASSCQPGSNITAGSPSSTLQVSGTNYLSGAVVIWTVNGTATKLVTAQPDPTVSSLLAVIPASLLSTPGTALITVQNPDNGISNGVLFSVVTGATPVLNTVTAVGSVILGSPVQLAITGTDFANGAQVLWNGSATGVTTVFTDSGDLTAIVQGSLVASPATVSITVQSAGATSNARPFTIPGITLSSLAPNQAVAGTGPITATINGGNFTSSSMVQWTGGAGPQSITPTVLSPTQLSIIVPTSFLTTAGTAFVSVVNGTLTTNALPFTVTAAPSTAPTIFTDGTGLGICPGGSNCQASNSVVAGSPSIILQVSGLNYQPSSVVVWTSNGTATNLTTAYLFATAKNPNPTLQATVPASLLASPGTALITVVNPDKTISNGVLFTVGTGQTPTITAITAVGPVVIGSQLQIALTGTNFMPGSLVQWNNGATTTGLATTFVDATDLSASVPANLVTGPGTVQITVQSGGATSAPKPFTIPTITISSLSPNSAVAGTGNLLLTVSGGNFTAASVVQWNAGAAPAPLATTLVSTTQLTALVPASMLTTAGTTFVSVLTGTVTTNTLPFTIQSPAAPSISSLSVTSVQAGAQGFSITVIGTNFVNGAVVMWNASGAPLPLTTAFISSTQLTALIPATLIAAPANAFLSVQNPGGGGLSNLTAFNITSVAPPTIATTNGLAPASVATGTPGTTITVTGTNFVNGAVVIWNAGTATPLTTGYVSATQLTALIPANLLGQPTTALVSVQNPDKTTSNTVPFSVLGAPPVTTPSIASISPASADAGTNGVTLSVSGTNFANGAVVVWNGGTATPLATGFSSATQLTALVPASLLTLPGTALVSVTNPDKTSTNAVTFAITGSAPVTTPTLTSIAPTTAAAGSPSLQLTVTGQNFVGPSTTAPGTVVQWNGAALPTTFSSATQLVATVDSSLLQAVGSNFVSVVTGTNSSAGKSFQVVGPTLTTVAPATTTAGGPAFSLTLTGTNFVSGTVVLWNTTKLSTAVNSGTQLTAQVTPDLIATAGTAFIMVTNPGGAATSPQIFTIGTPPASTISTLSPPSAIAGGAAFQLTVNGTGFVNGSVVMWNGSPLATGYVSATQITALIDSTLIATAGNANVAVQNPGAAVSAGVKFAINGPTITTLTPATANAGDPGFTLTVAGTNFIPGAAVLWNGSILPTLYGAATQLQATVPASLIANPGTASITVQNAGGAASGILVFTIGPPSLHIMTATLPDGVVGTSYSQVLQAQGGSQPYTWTVSSGNLPGGLGLDPASGTLSGTPTGAANGTVGFTCTDSAGRIAKVSLQLNIALALTITTPSPLPMATAGTAYSAQLAATGGTPSYLWSVNGNLPPGLIFNVATGRISGVPTAPGSFTFTVGVTDSRQQQNATATLTLPVTVSALNVTGLSTTVGPAQQVPLTVSVANSYTVDLTGTLTLSFTSAVGGDDPSIQFSTTGRTVTFTIPAGSTTAVYPQNQQLLVSTGTVAGTITIKATLQAGGSDITPATQAPVTTTVPKQVPVITSATLKQVTGGVVVAITGYSTTKELTQATLAFNAASGGSLTTGTTTVALTAVINSWFQSAAAAGFGGQFTVSIPIAVSGSVSAIGSVTITLTNSQGNSAQVTAPLQ